MTQRPPASLQRSGDDYHFQFHAMATPCELRLETQDRTIAMETSRAVEAEALRIEQKFSRYRDDSIVGKINASDGKDVNVDEETAHLLNFAANCFLVSGGLFDITSGVLRRIWKFDASDRLATAEQIKSVKPLVGWNMVTWRAPVIALPPGMEIDLGGLAKEYAVDQALAEVQAITNEPALVNFGGDLRVSGLRKHGVRWKVAIESVETFGQLHGLLELASGAIATSGDSRRYLLKNGVRYGHILNPRTGRPVARAPRSVTVAAATCVEAGMLATLAVLQGRNAEKFLNRESVRAWCIR
jgi:thiamine biosynthesis lipoprotein